MEDMNGKTNPPSSPDVWFPLRRGDLTPETVRHVRSILDSIPEMPVSVQRVIRMASDPECDSAKIAEVVSSDPVLVSNILMMVNSSYYGLSRKIDNLRLAIVLLGFNEVRNIAIRCGLFHVMGKVGTGPSFDTRSLWVHSYMVALCTESFADEEDPQRAGVFFTLGMLHDIGKFALYTVGMMMRGRGMHPAFAGTISPDAHVLEKEDRLFGINHAIVGGLLSERWNFSERIATVIENHHLPSFAGVEEIPEEYLEDVAAVCIADSVINRRVRPESPQISLHPHYYEILRLPPPTEQIISPELEEKLELALRFVDRFG